MAYNVTLFHLASLVFDKKQFLKLLRAWKPAEEEMKEKKKKKKKEKEEEEKGIDSIRDSE